MKWCGLFWTIAFAIAGFSAQAQVFVQSGEHDEFSRLVFEYPSDRKWDIRQNEKTATVVLNPNGYLLDVSRVFQRLPRNRIAEVRNTQEGLQIEFNCRCQAEGFRTSSGYLVIDVKEGEAPASQGSAEVETPRLRFDDQSESSFPILAKLLQEQAQKEEPQVQTAQEALESSREEILQSVSRALSQGLLSPKPQTSTDENVAVLEQIEADLQKNTPDNLNTGTSLDPPQAVRPELPPGSCERMTVFEWSEVVGNTPAEQLALVSGLIVEDKDKLPDAASIERAALILLGLGFGAEARQVLESFDIENTELDAIGALVDGEPLQDEPTFWGATDCDGPAALWAILAQTGTDDRTNINETAIQVALAELPAQLRQAIIPRLHSQLRTAGVDLNLDDLKTPRPKLFEPNEEGTMVEVALLPEKELKLGSEVGSDLGSYLRDAVQKGRTVDVETLAHAEAVFLSLEDGALRQQFLRDLALAQLRAARIVPAVELLTNERLTFVEDQDFFEKLVEVAVTTLTPAELAVFATSIEELLDKSDLKSDLLSALDVVGMGAVMQETMPKISAPPIPTLVPSVDDRSDGDDTEVPSVKVDESAQNTPIGQSEKALGDSAKLRARLQSLLDD